MRGPSKDLHELIHALSPREITSCRKRMREFDSDMRRLFEAFLSHPEYNDADFRAATGRIWNDNQWSVAKNYLHQSIMIVLVNHRKHELSAWNVRPHLQYLDILYGKELYRQCHKKLEQISRTVEKLDDPVLRNEIIQWRYRLHSRNYHQVPMEEFDDLNRTYKENNSALQEYLHCQYLHQQFQFILRNRGLVQERGLLVQAFSEIMADPILQDDATPASLATQLLADYTQGTWKYLHADFKGAHFRFQRVVQQMELRKGWRMSHQELYFGALYWYSLCTIETLDFEESRTILTRMEQLRDDSPYNKARIFYYKTQLDRSLTSLFGDAAANLKVARQILRDLPRHQARCRPAEVVNLYFNVGLSFILGESYPEAMHCFLQILQQKVVRELPEYEMTSKLLLLLLCLENGDRDLYRHYRRSLRRMLNKSPDAYPLESLVMDGLGTYAAARNDQDRTNAFRELIAQLEVLEGIAANYYFDFDAWCRSCLGEGSFREIYQQKALKELEKA